MQPALDIAIVLWQPRMLPKSKVHRMKPAKVKEFGYIHALETPFHAQLSQKKWACQCTLHLTMNRSVGRL